MANKSRKQTRSDALSQLKEAQEMIAEGRAELVRANDKIRRAQKLIDDSAGILRQTWSTGKSN